MSPRPTGEQLLAIAVEVAHAAAVLVRERRAAGVSVAATKTSDVDVVTEADRASEELIRAMLAERRPDDAVMGEEGDDVEGTSGVRWVVDPIDGTVNFLYGLPEYSVSIAAELDGETVAGVVAEVPHGTTYTAWVEADGTVRSERDGVPLAVRAPGPLGQRLIASGFSYEPDLRARQAQAWAVLISRVRDLRRHGSAALELCHVAEGALDGYFEEGVHPWDFAAGALVARGAGARFERLVGMAGRTLVLCAPEDGFEELHEAVVAAGFTDAGPA